MQWWKQYFQEFLTNDESPIGAGNDSTQRITEEQEGITIGNGLGGRDEHEGWKACRE